MDKKMAMFCLCAVIAIFVVPSVIFAASFDCGKATTEIEKLICGNDELSKLDESLNKAYLQALNRTDIKQQIIESQRQWLKYERNACHNAECVKTAYKTRIKDLSLMSPSGKKALPANRKSRTIANRDITETRVTSLAVTSDGTRIITGDENGSIKIWKKDDLSMLLAIPGHRYRTSQVIVSPDDRYIVSYSTSDDDVNVWELPSGRLAHTYRLGGLDQGGLDQKIMFNKKGTLLLITNTSEIMAMPFKIGKQYAVTTRDEVIWSMNVAEESHYYLMNAVLSPDKEVLATALNGGEEFIVHLWKCSQGTWGTKAEIQRIKTIRQEKKRDDRIDQVALTNAGGYLLAGTLFGLVYVYDISRDPPKLVRTIETGRRGWIRSLAVNENDTKIIIAANDDSSGVVEMWDLKTGVRIYKRGRVGVFPLAVLQGNSLILGSYRGLWIEDINSGENTLMQPKQRAGAVSTLAISKSKTVMVSAGWDNRIVNIWNIPSFGLKMSVPTRHNYHTAFISPDDKSVVLGSSDGTIVVMDLQSGRIIHEIQAHPNFEPGIHFIFVSPDGKYIISEKMGIKKVFQISDGKEVTDNSVCNIPVGEVIAQSANDYIVANKVNDGNDKITVHSTVGRALWEVDLSPYSYEPAGNSAFNSALLSPDAQYVFFALRTGVDKPGAIIQFSRDSGKRIREVGTNSCCVLAANKKYLISGGDDKRAIIWDIATGKQLRRLYGHQDTISAIQIVDNVAITAAFDGQIFVWSLPEGKLKKILRHQ